VGADQLVLNRIVCQYPGARIILAHAGGFDGSGQDMDERRRLFVG
jgi:predicted TIM-barrel fold metal-dependent hydrolase